MCLFPEMILNPKYKYSKKNGGNIPTMNDPRVKYVPVGCGKCMECKKQKSREWKVRLNEELKDHEYAEFVTFTFSAEELAKVNKEIPVEYKGYERDNKIATYAMRHFLEKWRKKYGRSVRHWAVTELGGGRYEHLHIHAIIFLHVNPNHTKGIKQQYILQQKESIKERWGYGFTYIGKYVNSGTIGYIVKYITDTDEKHPNYNAKVLSSKGIGSGYLLKQDHRKNKYNKNGTNEQYRLDNGRKVALPIYYRNKIYTEEEREKLWLEKLDKNVRYVDGIKIDVSKNDDAYYMALKEARRKNKRLKYGDNQEDWTKIKYENQRADILRKTKMEIAHAQEKINNARARKKKKNEEAYLRYANRIKE